MKVPVPAAEAERLAALHRYDILDTAPEPEYDDLTFLASLVCGTPIALISLVDAHRLWFKSSFGLELKEISRDNAFYLQAILQPRGVFIVEDALNDARFSSNPFVTSGPEIRFYAGAPLITSDGHVIGTLCVMDREPRSLDENQKAALQALSRRVIGQMELQRSVAELERTDKDLRWKTAFLEAQVNSSLDGILVIDPSGQPILQNQKSIDMVQIPQEFIEAKDHLKQLRWVSDRTSDPEGFYNNTIYLCEHPEVIFRDEVEFNDGMIQDRYSSPVVGSDGTYYGRIWTFRDIRDRKKAEKALRDSQVQHRALIENMREGYVLGQLVFKDGVAVDYIYLEVNKAFEPLTGLKNVTGRLVSEVVPGIHQSNPEQLERYARVARTGEPEQCESYVKNLDVWFAISVYSHQPGYFVTTFDNITERKQTEAILRESDERFRQLADHVSDGFWICSPDFQEVLYTSPAFDRIWGEPMAFNQIPPLWMESIFPEDRPWVESAFEQLTTNQPSVDIEYRIQRLDGEIRWVQMRGYQVRNAEGQLIRLTGIATDITEHRRAEAELTFERDLLHTLLEHCPDHIYFKDLESRVIRSSHAQARKFGFTDVKDMIGKNDFDFFTSEHATTAFNEEQEIIRTGVPLIGIMEREVLQDGGQVSWVLTSKMPLRRNNGEIIGTFGISTDITPLKEAEARLVRERERFQLIFDSIPVGVALCRHFPDGTNERIINDAHLDICGLTREQDLIPGIYGKITHLEDVDRHAELYRQFERGETDRISLEKRYHRLDGETAWVVFYLQRHTYPDGVYDHLSTVVDITKRKSLEIQLFQSQKMEVVGKLAGGVAHEFNSILTAIIGQSELLLNQLPTGSPLGKNATEIIEASGRAANLTRQLLAFGSKQMLRPETLNLNRVLASMRDVLQHLIGHKVEIRILPSPDLRAVKVDAGQIEQVIMNLAINARDAMPSGGSLTLETSNVSISAEAARLAPDLAPGDYVLLAITDTGHGMSAAVKARAFEPFFTTKDVGQGTGLGLATCYGIVNQSGGHISVYSEVGKGTTVKIHLPQTEMVPKNAVRMVQSPNLPRGSETILLVEEDPAMREMVTILLRKLGYVVHPVVGALDALGVQQQPDIGHIDLLIAEVALAHMTGKELARRVQAFSPEARVLLTAAANGSALAEPEAAVAFLHKPFTPSALAHRIREVLDAVVCSEIKKTPDTFFMKRKGLPTPELV